MRVFICIAVFSLFLKSSYSENIDESITLVQKAPKKVEEILLGPGQACLSDQKNEILSIHDLADGICTGLPLSEGKVSMLKVNSSLRYYLEALRKSPEEFIDSLTFFINSQNKMIENFGKKLENPWVMPSATEGQAYSDKNLRREEEFYLKKIFKVSDNSEVSFYGVKHFYTMNENEVEKAISHYLEELSSHRPEALVLEGFQIGQGLPCDLVIKNALKNPMTIIESEIVLGLVVGFWNKIDLIPGDNQNLDLSFLNHLPKNEHLKVIEAAKKSYLPSFIYAYYDAIRKKKVLNPISYAYESTKRKGFDIPSIDEVIKVYEELGERPLPTTAEEVYLDMTPRKYLPPDVSPRKLHFFKELLDDLRNSGILSTVQMASEKYEKTSIMFGVGHLWSIGPRLESLQNN